MWIPRFDENMLDSGRIGCVWSGRGVGVFVRGVLSAVATNGDGESAHDVGDDRFDFDWDCSTDADSSLTVDGSVL